MIQADNLAVLEWLVHGFGLRDSPLPVGITTVRQIHSATVVDAAGRRGVIGEADAIVSRQSGVTSGIKTADCVPLLLADPVTHTVAAIHAGWRGTAANIAAKAVAELVERWGVHPGNIRAAIGPSISVCCYEVGPEVANRFETWHPELGLSTGPVHIDLPAINRAQLEAAGVRDIWISGECTFCHAERFHSFRRDRERAGRMMSIIGIR